VAVRFFRPTATGASLGFHPSRVVRRKPWPGLPPASSRVLGILDGDRRIRPHHRVSISSRLASPAPCRSTGSRSNPLRVSAPALS